MRITEAAARLGMSPRMLRYREDLGLLPPLRDRPTGRGPAHRQFTEEDLAAITAALAIERRFDITPAALAFGLRVLTDPAARTAVADLGRRTGHVPAGPGAGRALDFEKERALRALRNLRNWGNLRNEGNVSSGGNLRNDGTPGAGSAGGSP
jgi:MerR family copper efflux transcriptional regulator